MLLLEQEINKARKILENVLTNPDSELNPIITQLNNEASKRSYLHRLLLLLADMSQLPLNIFFTTKENHSFDKLLYSNFSKNTKFHVYKYESFEPNAFTVPGNLTPGYPMLTIVGAKTEYLPAYQLLTMVNYIIKNISIYKDFKPNMSVKPVDLNMPDIAVFFSDSLASRVQLTDNELFAVILHEIGHNMIRKSHINYLLIAIITLLITKLFIEPYEDKISKNRILPKLTFLEFYKQPTNQLLFLILLTCCVLFIRNYFRRSLEYKSDGFASQMGYRKESQSALTKLYNTLAYGAEVDNKIERLMNFIPRNMFKIINFIMNIPIFGYPSFQQRVNKLQTESTLLSEAFVDNIYEKLVNKLIDILSTMNKLYNK